MGLINRLRHDFSGEIFYQIRKYRLKWITLRSGLITYPLLRLKGVKVGKNCTFYGIPDIRRYPGSTIIIEPDCKFRSHPYAGNIGINRRCLIYTRERGAVIRIGRGSGITGGVITARNLIDVGEGFLCGANALLTDSDGHYVQPDLRHTNGAATAPITIKDNVWLGTNAVVLKGVTIGENSVIGANSLVIKDVPANVVAGGTPCKVIKNLVTKDESIAAT